MLSELSPSHLAYKWQSPNLSDTGTFSMLPHVARGCSRGYNVCKIQPCLWEGGVSLKRLHCPCGQAPCSPGQARFLKESRGRKWSGDWGYQERLRPWRS